MKKIIIFTMALGLIIVSCSENNTASSTVDKAVKASSVNKNENGTTDIISGENVTRIATSARVVTNSMEDFMLYKATITFPRVASKNPTETRSAKSFALVSYSDFISSTYTIDGVVYNDNGSVNDLIPGDEIYTSDALYQADTVEFDYEHLKYISSKDFIAQKEIQEDFANGTLQRRSPPKGIKGYLLGLASDFVMGCSYSYTTQGTTLLGFSCSSGCLQIDCR